jgi:uncharacterized protein (TIGR00304 family)
LKSRESVSGNHTNLEMNNASSSWKTRGVILIGPIPIFIGYHKRIVIILSIILLIFLWVLIGLFLRYC